MTTEIMAVVEASNAFNSRAFTIANCPHCGGSGKQYDTGGDACHSCGGTGDIVEQSILPDDLRKLHAAQSDLAAVKPVHPMTGATIFELNESNARLTAENDALMAVAEAADKLDGANSAMWSQATIDCNAPQSVKNDFARAMESVQSALANLAALASVKGFGF